MSDDIPEPHQEILTIVGNMYGETVPELDESLREDYDFDIRDVSEADAKQILEHIEAGDFGEIPPILDRNDFPEALVQQFRNVAGSDAAGDSSDGGGFGDQVAEKTAQADADDSDSDESAGVTEQDVEAKIERAVNQRVSQLEDNLMSQLQDMSGDGGDVNPQQKMAMQLAQTFLQKEMGGGGGGQMAELGQEFQKAALQRQIYELRKPSLGDIAERKFFEKHADGLIEDEVLGEGMDLNVPGDDDDEDDDSDPWWKF